MTSGLAPRRRVTALLLMGLSSVSAKSSPVKAWIPSTRSWCMAHQVRPTSCHHVALTSLKQSSSDSSDSSSDDAWTSDWLSKLSGGEKSVEKSFGAENVPEGQRPANEYLNLISQPLFDWGSQGDGYLLRRLAVVYAAFFGLIGYPIAGATFTQDGYLLSKILAANVGTLGIIILLLVRLSSGWGYVGSRLTSDVIEYEETGWYDTDFERKTEAERARDLLLFRSKVEPAVSRCKTFTLAAAALFVLSAVALRLVAPPVFDEYNPNLLKELPYNEKLAQVAAQQSKGKPTYCDSRYYRAIANGGQGCK